MGLFRELRYELSSLIFGLGILAMIFSLTQYLIPTQSPDWLQSIHRAVGNYVVWEAFLGFLAVLDRKSTRLNSSHLGISYAVFCLKILLQGQDRRGCVRQGRR